MRFLWMPESREASKLRPKPSKNYESHANPFAHFFVRNIRTTQFARSRFKIHPLTGFSMSLDSPRNQHTSFTPSHANLAASAKQSRLVIELRNVVLCMTNVCQTRSVYEARRPRTCLMTCVKDGWAWKINRAYLDERNSDFVRKPKRVISWNL